MEDVRNKLQVVGRAIELYDELVSQSAQARVNWEIQRNHIETSTEARKQARTQYEKLAQHVAVGEETVLRLSGQDSIEEARITYEVLSASFQYYTELQQQVIGTQTIIDVYNGSDTVGAADSEDRGLFLEQLDALAVNKKRLYAAEARVLDKAERLGVPEASPVDIEIVRPRIV